MTIPIFILAILPVIAFWFGVHFGIRIQYRAGKGLTPPLMFPKRPEKVEVGDDDVDPAVELLKARKVAFATELAALEEDDLRDRAEFFNVTWDERPENRGDVVDRIIQSRFHPGAYRA